MRGTQDSLAVLRRDAGAAVDRFLAHLAIGRGLGMTLPTDAQIRARLAGIDRFDVAALSADSRCLVAAHRAVSEHLHQLPEQQIRLDRGWRGSTASEAIVTVINHQRRAESDLDVLRTLTDATSAAASGIDRLLRTFLLTLTRVGEPTIAGCPVAELGPAVLAGRVPIDLVIADIDSRVTLFATSTDAVGRGIGGILTVLDRSTSGLGDEPYPATRTARPPRMTYAPGPQATVTHVDHDRVVVTPKEPTPGPEPSAAASIPAVGSRLESGHSQDADDVPLRLGDTGPAATTRQSPRPPAPGREHSPGDLALAGDQ